ncbi:hypothetical protein TNCV_3999571 [Trichonephila clavipes]|nr:hypothetical protein TNCV_3999571 [Trichonephila clavipes]
MMIPAYNKRGCAAFYSRWESITGESPTSFPEENTTTPYSGFEPTRLQAEAYIHHTGWIMQNVYQQLAAFAAGKMFTNQ